MNKTRGGTYYASSFIMGDLFESESTSSNEIFEVTEVDVNRATYCKCVMGDRKGRDHLSIPKDIKYVYLGRDTRRLCSAKGQAQTAPKGSLDIPLRG